MLRGRPVMAVPGPVRSPAVRGLQPAAGRVARRGGPRRHRRAGGAQPRAGLATPARSSAARPPRRPTPTCWRRWAGSRPPSTSSWRAPVGRSPRSRAGSCGSSSTAGSRPGAAGTSGWPSPVPDPRMLEPRAPAWPRARTQVPVTRERRGQSGARYRVRPWRATRGTATSSRLPCTGPPPTPCRRTGATWPASWNGPERLGVADPAGVDRKVLRRYVSYLATRGYARRTVARKAAALRRYFGWLRRVRHGPGRPLSGVVGAVRIGPVASGAA